MPQLMFGGQSTSRKEAVLAFHHMGLGNQTQAARLDSAFTCSAICAARHLVWVVLTGTNSEACVYPASPPPTSMPLAPKHIPVYFSVDEWVYRTLPTYEFLLFSMPLLLPTSHDYTNYIPFGYFTLTQRTL